MAFTFGFYNSLNHDRKYNSTQMSEIFDGLILDGVYVTVGKCFLVKASSVENRVVVQSGRAWFDHTWNKNDADLVLEATQSDILLDRIDAVVLDIRSAEKYRKNDIIWVTGTAKTNPVKPTLIKEPGHTQYPLAYVRRPAGSQTITQGNITNAVGTSECPFVTGLLEGLDGEELMLQWAGQWDEFYRKYTDDMLAVRKEWISDILSTKEEWTADLERWYNGFTSSNDASYTQWLNTKQALFEQWFEQLQVILDADTAANLAQIVADLKNRTTDLEKFANDIKSDYSIYYTIQDDLDLLITDGNGDPIIGRAIFVMK